MLIDYHVVKIGQLTTIARKANRAFKISITSSRKSAERRTCNLAAIKEGELVMDCYERALYVN